MTNRIGWVVTEYDFTIKAGSNGSYQFVLNVTNQDGTALPTYDGWTAAVSFKSPFTSQAVITKTPTVTGDGVAKTLTFDLDFVSADTANLQPAKYEASVWLLDPTDSGFYCPANLSLTVEQHD